MGVGTRTTYRIETFGGLSVAGGSAPLTGAATQRKTLLLLAVLASAGPQGISREKLLGLFWPDSDTERARHTLKQALHILRRDLREPELIVGTPTLHLNPDVITADVAEFEEAIGRGELELAVALHRGPYLDGLYLDGAPELERWIERERGRLAHLHATALERLAAQAAASGDRAAAVGWWRRLAAVDPLSSRIALSLMEALVAAGDPEAALQHARVHEALVRQELETSPDPAVQALVERVRAGLGAPRALPAPAPPPTAEPAAAPPAPAPAPVAPAAVAAPPVPAAIAHARPSRPSRAVRQPRRSPALLGAAVAAALALTAWGVGRPGAEPVPAAAAAPRSVAVLPFVDLSAGGGQGYLGDGMGDALITALGRVDGLHVTARTSSFALRDARLDVRAIGDTLGVATVVEGSVRREGDRLRVSARLVDARSGYELWSARYDREVGDMLAVQDEIAGAIAGALRLTLAGGGGAAPAQTASVEAYDLYLRGTWFRSRLSSKAIATAVGYFDQAIALDPAYARAYAGKATALGPPLYFDPFPREPRLTELRAAAAQALALDDRLGEAHVAMGIIHMFYEWDWEAAERELRRAIALDPADAHAFHHWANWLRTQGRVDESIETRRRALALDPLNPRTHLTLGHDYMVAGRYDEAALQFRRGMDLDPDNPLVLGLGPALPLGMAEVHEVRGRHAEAVAEYARIAARRGAREDELRAMRDGLARGGMPGFWRAWLAFETRAANGTPRAIRMAAIHARLGERARALDLLEQAWQQRDPGMIYLASHPGWVSLREEPRFVALRERMQLPR